MEKWPPNSLPYIVSWLFGRMDEKIVGISLQVLLLKEVPFAYEDLSCYRDDMDQAGLQGVHSLSLAPEGWLK